MTEHKRKRLENLSNKLDSLNSLWKDELALIDSLITDAHEVILTNPKTGYSYINQAKERWKQLELRYRQEMREARRIEEVLYKENFR